ncbi:lipopolysaccharide core heptose(I) kinase RfaP [Arenicella sp. 4NH20-0111]|uniref:lipopolysaccharide core heptose(I) kinase RfaP n=1 Tax=Arenicella sp. 4NH20-0111 TaxID=3127648 RepID=UPI00333FE7C3
MLRIANECIQRGHKATVFTGSWEGDVPDGLEVIIIKHFGLTNHTRAHSFHRKLRKQLDDHSFDVVVGFNKIPELDIYYCGDYCYVGRSFLRHSWFYRFTPRFLYFSNFERGVFNASSKTNILSLSDREKLIYQQYYLTQDSRFLCLPPTLEKARWAHLDKLPNRESLRTSLGIKEDENLVLLIGSGFQTKGLDRAIVALAALPTELLLKTKLFVVGQDKIDTFQRIAKRYGVSDQIHFLGGRKDVPALMKAGDMLLHPAYAETTGGVLLEAIVSGLPVLATPVCGYAPHIKTAEAGHVLRKRFSQEELNTKLHEMLLSQEKETWRQNGLSYGQNPGLYVMPQRAVDFIEQTCAQRSLYLNRTDEKSTDEQLYITNELRQALRGEDSFYQMMNIGGKVYREALGRRTLRFTRGEKDYFLKMHTGVGWGEIFKNIIYLRAPVVGALNEWHGVHRLKDLEIDTMTVSAYGIRGRNPATKHSFIVTEALPTETSLEDFCGEWSNNPPTTLKEIRLKRWILNKVVETARVIHENGANHRDFYLCHFLLDAHFEEDNHVSQESKLYLIDLHRIQMRRKTPERWAVKDIAGLYYSSKEIGLTQRDLYRFMKLYRGKSLREILRTEMPFWRKVVSRGNKLYESEKRKARVKESLQRQRAQERLQESLPDDVVKPSKTSMRNHLGK